LRAFSVTDEPSLKVREITAALNRTRSPAKRDVWLVVT
jgi:hypothetical protein